MPGSSSVEGLGRFSTAPAVAERQAGWGRDLTSARLSASRIGLIAVSASDLKPLAGRQALALCNLCELCERRQELRMKGDV